MHDGVGGSHDPWIPSYALGNCDGCYGASALCSACKCICTPGPNFTYRGWCVANALHAICGSWPCSS
eukprot:12250833-Karenia_brevis.AAC.1